MSMTHVAADVAKLPEVSAFVEAELEKLDCPMKAQFQISVAVEEIYVNIASYAYPSGEGWAEIDVSLQEDPRAAVITFSDSGIPYNPLEREDPDVTLAAEDRPIGGLGIFMVKKSMDDIRYARVDGKNVLTIVKNI